MKIACIGSRQISNETFEKLKLIGRHIALKNWKINSGNATGSDYAFASGANEINPNAVRIYLPWPKYNQNHLVPGNELFFDTEPEWIAMARKHHPIYNQLTQGVKKMMDRNAGIVMNSQVVIAYLNHNATGHGGTGHGWRIAGELKLPRIDVSGLEKGMTVEEVLKWLQIVNNKLKEPV
jgi:hypothetical protein